MKIEGDIFFNIIFNLVYIFLFFFNRGLFGLKKVLFRKWYGCLGEFRFLILIVIRLVILIVIVIKVIKGEILNIFYLFGEDIKFIE